MTEAKTSVKKKEKRLKYNRDSQKWKRYEKFVKIVHLVGFITRKIRELLIYLGMTQLNYSIIQFIVLTPNRTPYF
jgi:hypothetical protein